MSANKSSAIRRQLNHPVIDADGHWLELFPIFFDYLAEVGGPAAVDNYRAQLKRTTNWYQVSQEGRMRDRIHRQSWWTLPTNTIDRTAAMVPALFYDRLDEWGIDVALTYPTLGFIVLRTMDDQALRQTVIRAYNVMAADLFKPFSDRIIPAACICLDNPGEAIEQLEHARSLGLKLMMANGTTVRQVNADAGDQRGAGNGRIYLDAYGLDSPFDYDGVWKKCVELKVAMTFHTGARGWPDHSSPTNFVSNHLGHFAQSHHLTARSLFLGGVTQRFPGLNFGFLEGGAGWACNLLADLMGHWEKRNRKFMHEYIKPTLFDRVKARQLMEKYTGNSGRFQGKIDDILERNIDVVEPDITQEQLAARDMDSDDFARVSIDSKKDIKRLYTENFYFGCEADDPMTAMAFHPKAGLRVKAMLGSDISHFDVVDATEVLEEAWEMVEHELISEADFREFTFTNAVQLHGRVNPQFFDGTVVEKAARLELGMSGSSPAAEPV